METTPLMRDEEPPSEYDPNLPPNEEARGYRTEADQQGPPVQAQPPQGYPPQQGHPPQQPYPPQQAYPAPPVQHTTVITQPVVTVTSLKFSDHPVQLRCTHCQKDVVTQLNYTPGALTWIVVAVLFVLGFWLCCLIPLCIDSLKDVNHVCPNCGTLQGTYRRLTA